MKLARVKTRQGVLIAETLQAPSGDGVAFRALDEGELLDVARRAMDPTLTTPDAVAPGNLTEAAVDLLAPCASPIYLTEMEGNHRELLPPHHLGRGYPMLTVLPGTVVNRPGAVVTPPPWSTRLVVQAELAFVCARPVAGAGDATADAVLGYTLMIAMADCSLVDQLAEPTSRDVSMNEDYGRWFDGYRPLGPWLVTADELRSVRELEVTLRVGERHLVASGAGLVYEPLDILARLSSHVPFSAGDIVGLGGMGQGIEVRRPSHPARVEVTASCDQIGELVCALEFPGGPSSTGHPGDAACGGTRRVLVRTLNEANPAQHCNPTRGEY